MTDVNKLLEGGIDDVTAAFDGMNHDTLLKVKTAEEAGKKRKGVLEAVDAALAKAAANRVGGFTSTASAPAIAADLDTSGPASIAAATGFAPSGAPEQVTDIDVAHPAVDNDPRAGTTADQNRIDFNDPVRPGHEIVENALKR